MRGEGQGAHARHPAHRAEPQKGKGDASGKEGEGQKVTFPASLQMGTNKCASQSGMTAYGTRRHLYDPKNHILPPMDHSTISLQMGTNKCASQVGRPSSPRPPCPDSASACWVSPGKLLPSSALVSKVHEVPWGWSAAGSVPWK